MEYKKIIPYFFLIISLVLVSCAPVYWELKKSLRKPGENLLAHPDKVWKEYHCEKQRRPFFKLTKYEILPLEVKPGEEINQHFEYIFCPAKPAQVLQGKLWRRIYFKGKLIFDDLTPNFEIKPGKWAVDAFIRVSPQASPGIYYLEIVFKSSQIKFKEGLNFVVKP